MISAILFKAPLATYLIKKILPLVKYRWLGIEIKISLSDRGDHLSDIYCFARYKRCSRFQRASFLVRLHKRQPLCELAVCRQNDLCKLHSSPCSR